MPLPDDDTAYSGDPLPRKRAADDARRPARECPPPQRDESRRSESRRSDSRRGGYDNRDFDDEPLPRRPSESEERRHMPSSVVTSLGTVGIVFGILHIVGALVMCITGTVVSGFFFGFGQAVANDPNAVGGRGQPQAKEVIDVCNGFGLVTGAVLIAPGIVYALAALGLIAGGGGTIRRRHWARVLLLIWTPLVLLLDGGSFFVNPISGAIAGILALGYAIFAYIVLLLPDNAEEFA